MKKHKNLILFLIITLIRSVFLGMLKTFLRSALKEDSRTLEEIAGYISLGVTLSYLVGGALTYTFRKKPIAIGAGLVVIGCLLYGYFTDYFPFKNFTVIIGIMGFFYGLWLTIKGIITTTEILESGRSETTINGIANIAILIGILVGSYAGFISYNKLQGVGFIIIVGLILVATILTCFLTYDKIFKKHRIKSAITKNIPNITAATKRYVLLLVPIGIFWAVCLSTAQKMLEIGIDVLQKAPTKGIIVIIISMVGVILGHIFSTFIKTKRIPSVILTTILGISLFIFPNFLKINDTMTFLTIYSGVLGIIFGIVINSLEGRFYHKIGNEKRKEFGSAAYGLITSLIMFIIMIGGNRASKHMGTTTSFAFFGIAILACVPFIYREEKPENMNLN